MKASVFFFSFLFIAENRSMLAFSSSVCQVGEKNYKIDIRFPPLRNHHTLQICNPCMTVPLNWTHTCRSPSKTPFLPSRFHHNCHIIWNTECLHDISPSIAPQSIFSSRRVCHLLVEMESCKFDELNEG